MSELLEKLVNAVVELRGRVQRLETQEIVVEPRLNLLTNPGYEIWQRGNGPFTASGAYTADRWQIGLASSTVSVAPITSTIGSPGLSAQFTYTHAAGGAAVLTQKIERYAALKGCTLTFSMLVKCSVVGRVRLGAWDGANFYYSSYNATTSAELLTLTFTLPSGATDLQVRAAFNEGNCVTELNDAVLVVGAAPAAYQPLDPAEEWARCQRYYEATGGGFGNVPRLAGDASTAGQQIGVGMLFQVRKAAAVTLTKTGTWVVSNCAQPGAVSASAFGYYLYTTANAAGALHFYPDSSDDTIVAESNP